MHLTERKFRATQPLSTEVVTETTQATIPAARSRDLYRAPRSAYHVIAIVTRAETVFALLMPVVYGSVLAWWLYGQVNAVVLLFCLAGVTATGLGFNSLSEYYDYRKSRSPEVQSVDDMSNTGCGLCCRGVVAPGIVRDVGRILLAIGFLCTLWLMLLCGWPMLFFSGLSFMIVLTSIVIPHRFGSAGWGANEAGTLVGLGVLPVIGSFYAQTQSMAWLPLLVSIPCSLLVALVFFNYNATNYRRDWLIHKRTLAVNLGLARASDFSAVLTVFAYVSILLIVSLTELPLLVLVGLAPLPVALGVFARLQRESLKSNDFIALYKTAINAGVWTGLLFAAALITDKFI